MKVWRLLQLENRQQRSAKLVQATMCENTGARVQDSEQRDIQEWNQGDGNNPEKRKGKGEGQRSTSQRQETRKKGKTSADQEKRSGQMRNNDQLNNLV